MPHHPTHPGTNRAARRQAILLALVVPLALGACSNPFGSGNPFRRQVDPAGTPRDFGRLKPIGGDSARQSSLFDLFTNAEDPDTTVEVNRFIWQAAQEVLNFMPVEAVDPFSGVIVYGFGVPPGGGRAYRATVHVTDPSLDARALNVALQSQGGPVDPATQRAVEDAILTRARQLRVAAGRL